MSKWRGFTIISKNLVAVTLTQIVVVLEYRDYIIL